MTRTTTRTRTLKRQAALLALAACVVASTTEATASTRPEQGELQKQRPQAGIIVSGIIVNGGSRASARSVLASGNIRQGQPQTGIIVQSGIIVTAAGQRLRQEAGIIQQRRA